jgi:hypothetical protein
LFSHDDLESIPTVANFSVFSNKACRALTGLLNSYHHYLQMLHSAIAAAAGRPM